MVPAHRTAGTGPGMLLLHGIGSSSASFAHQLDSLAEEFTLIAWDAPGYAASPDPAEPVTLDGYVTAAGAVARAALGPGPFHLVGVSWGGVIALRLAATHPELVRSLTVIGASLGSGTDPARARQMRSRTAELRRLGPQAFARARAPRLLAPDAPAELVETATRTMAEAIRLPGYGEAAESMASADLTADLPRITAPTLVLAGEHDTVTGPERAREIAAGIRGAVLATIPGAGHLANQEQPDRVNDWLRRTALATGPGHPPPPRPVHP
ncbi:alpha/beta fold hydrolase [Streptomyces sp. NPDC002490]|uniref:alpha/beta fold hydrolase n=1 Tax=Streptomyces sp. NPDC002490 TaxID=3154416 RepID=UPI0033166B2C